VAFVQLPLLLEALALGVHSARRFDPGITELQFLDDPGWSRSVELRRRGSECAWVVDRKRKGPSAMIAVGIHVRRHRHSDLFPCPSILPVTSVSGRALHLAK
jgi:hypothetical protein